MGLLENIHFWGFISQSCLIIERYSKNKLNLQYEKNVCTLGQENLITHADIWALNDPGSKFTIFNLLSSGGTQFVYFPGFSSDITSSPLENMAANNFHLKIVSDKIDF